MTVRVGRPPVMTCHERAVFRETAGEYTAHEWAGRLGVTSRAVYYWADTMGVRLKPMPRGRKPHRWRLRDIRRMAGRVGIDLQQSAKKRLMPEPVADVAA